MSWLSVLDFLDHRRGLLDGVVFSGGEPTVDRHLGVAIEQVRQRGFKIGLHTAGSYPNRLRDLLPQVDWVGFDVKAQFADYADTTGVRGSGKAAQESLDHVLASGVEYEIRTTRHPELISSRALKSMAASLRRCGVEKFALQEFRPDGCVDRRLDACPPPSEGETVSHLRTLFPVFSLRAAN